MLNSGLKINKLTILKFSHKNAHKEAYYFCLCECGKIITRRGSRIGKSCGCLAREKRPNISNEKSPNWKEIVGYRAIHIWVNKNKGKAKKCSKCQKQIAKIEWANIDHTYKRNLSDYIELCTSCHRKFDIENNNYKAVIDEYVS